MQVQRRVVNPGELLAQRQAEPGALVGTYPRSLHLAEGLHHQRDILRRDSDAGVDDGDDQMTRAIDFAFHGHGATRMGELYRIGGEIEQDLLHAALVGPEIGDTVRYLGRQGDVSVVGAFLHHAQAAFDDGTHLDPLLRQRQGVAFDARDVEDVVDEFQKMLSGIVDVLGVLVVLLVPQGTEVFSRHDFRKADDGIQRGPEFVAHVGEEFRLAAVGHFRFDPRRAGLRLALSQGFDGPFAFHHPAQLGTDVAQGVDQGPVGSG